MPSLFRARARAADHSHGPIPRTPASSSFPTRALRYWVPLILRLLPGPLHDAALWLAGAEHSMDGFRGRQATDRGSPVELGTDTS